MVSDFLIVKGNNQRRTKKDRGRVIKPEKKNNKILITGTSLPGNNVNAY